MACFDGYDHDHAFQHRDFLQHCNINGIDQAALHINADNDLFRKRDQVHQIHKQQKEGTMKRYILFAIFDNKAKGGAKDYGASFSSPDQARIYLTKAASVYEGRSVTFQLFDCKKERAVSFDYKISKKKKVNPAFGIISRILAIIIVLGLIAALAIPFIIKHIKP